MRKIWDIPGGIHPPENKKQSLEQSIATLPLPGQLVLPLNQHIGAPARAIVEVGDRVLKGQLLAEPAGYVSTGVHAPTSGTIVGIGNHSLPHPSGMESTCIFLQPDGEDCWIEHGGEADFRRIEPARLVETIRLAGIAGLGGAGFPSAVKLEPRQPIDTLIVNATECEPYITADDSLIRERAAEIVEGIKIVGHILGNPATILIGIEDNKPEAYEALEPLLADTGIELVEFPTKYPSGGEKQLIQILTGKEVPSGKLPSDLGIVCQNIGTCHAVYRAVVHGEPLISRITTVTGNACSVRRNYRVLLGTPISHLLEHSGFDAEQCPRLIMGGPMMGFTLQDPSVPVIKTTNCVLAPGYQEMPPAALPQPCIRCGMCAEACPASLLPQQLFWYAQSENFERLEAHNLFDCIECGACAYVCPSNIPLVQYYRAAKGEIRHIREEKIKADHSRQRFESHKTRLERAEAEKAARREARRKAAEAAQSKSAGSTSADDIIQAARARAEARKASPEQQRASLQRKAEAAQHRLNAAREKLAEAESNGQTGESLDRLRAAFEEAQVKLRELERKLSTAEPAQTQLNPAASADGSVIGKLAKSPRQLLEDKAETLHKKIAAAECKLDQATDAATASALQTGLEKQRQKLAEVQQQLADAGETGSGTAGQAKPDDAAARAIARAQARAAEKARLSPKEKLEQDLDNLTSRLDKARQRLSQAEAEGSDTAAALNNTVTTLAGKIEAIERQLAEANQ